MQLDKMDYRQGHKWCIKLGDTLPNGMTVFQRFHEKQPVQLNPDPNLFILYEHFPLMADIDVIVNHEENIAGPSGTYAEQ